MQGVVLTLGAGSAGHPRGHESATQEAIARRLAALKGYRFGGPCETARARPPPVYFVPSDTLVGMANATHLGIRSEEHLFGGVVPHGFVATKTITHSTLDHRCRVPEGWTCDFAAHVGDAVLDGYSAFASDDARRAAEQLLERGPVRVKRAKGIGGRGQWVVETPSELAQCLEAIERDELATFGVVVEEHLAEVTTYSVGQVRVAGIVASYWGTQRQTRNNTGTEVYGGSELHLVRGGFEALLAQPLSDNVRLAIMQACRYDAAALECYRPMFSSRRNYDVAQGIDAAGRPRSGVLEQSWRMGGASAAEVLALEAFAADAALHSVRASTVEVYGATDAPPADALVYFRDVDEHIGPLTKYATIDSHAHAR